MGSSAGTAPAREDSQINLGLALVEAPTDERLRYAKQLGADEVLFDNYYTRLSESPFEDLALTGEKEWSFKSIMELKSRVKDAGLKLNILENLPYQHYEKVMLGKEGRDDQLTHIKNTIRNLGRAGISTLGYHWMVNGVWYTSHHRRIRGGAKVWATDLNDLTDAPLTHDREYSEEEMWENYEYFLREVLPVAEEAGVTLALHPDDPPTDVKIGGIPRLFRSFENFKRAMDIVPSDNHALEFCLGNWSTMGSDLSEVIDYFGQQDKIEYVHFQTPSESLPRFHETFIDQEFYYDPQAILQAFLDVGFDGLIIPGHAPRMEGDDSWTERGRGYTLGYLRGTLDTLTDQH